MKYVFEKLKDLGTMNIERGYTVITIVNGEAICQTDDQKKLAIDNGGTPALTKKSKGKK